MNELQLHLNKKFIFLMIFMGLFSFGLSALFLWLGARGWPRLLDQEGMTLRNGKRYLWKDATEFRRVNLQMYGVSVGGRIDFVFGRKKIRLPLNSIAESREAVAFLSKRFGWRN